MFRFDQIPTTLLSSYSAKHGIFPPLLYFSFSLFLLSPPLSSAQAPPNPNFDPYSNARFSPSMAIIVVILLAALFLMGFFSIYIRHCSDSAPGSVRPLSGIRSRRVVARGLDRAVIETFPTFVYSDVKALKIGKGALECAVCLCEFEDDETLRLIPKCDHVFHPECVDAWLESHTTCPVCRANLVPENGESVHQLTESRPELDLEAQNDAVAPEPEEMSRHGERETQLPPSEPQVVNVNVTSRTLNRNRTRGSRSGRPPKFPRSHSTGHSLVHPGENTERFTLRLPADVRKQVMNRKLNRANSMVVLPTASSSRRGYRTGGEGSSRGKSTRRFEWMDRGIKSDRWIFSIAPPFISRASSLKSPKLAANEEKETSVLRGESTVLSCEPSRPPV